MRGDNIQCNTDTSSDAHEDGQHNVRGDVPDKAAPVALGVPILRLVVVRSAVMMRLVVGRRRRSMVRVRVRRMVGIFGAMRTFSVAATEALECLLGTAPHGGAGHLRRGHELHIGNDNIAGDGLDQANLDHGNVVDESVADLDDPQLDVHQLQLLLLVLGPGQDRQAVSQSALGSASACSHDIGSQVSTPRVGMGIQLKAIDHQS